MKPEITRREVEELKAKGRAVHIYPRKRVVCLDGFQYYKLKD